MIINNNSAFVIHFNSSFIEGEVVCMRFPSSRNQNMVSREGDLISTFDWFDCDFTMSAMILSWHNFMGS